MEEKFSFFLFLITIRDLYLNYNNREFPEYHKARVYSDILSLLSVLFPLFLIITICCMGCLLFFQCFTNNTAQKCTFILTIIFFLLVIIFAISSVYYQIKSLYIYFKYDGATKIKSTIIKVLMWITFVNIIIKLFFAVCDFISSLKNKKKEKDEELVELQDKEEDKKI